MSLTRARRAAYGALALLLVFCIGAWGVLTLSLPRTSGTVVAPGLSESVTIVRDRDAVPHIYAANEEDAARALGFVHAQDRLWQMELQRRSAYGRLAEIFGEAAIPRDRFLRTLGLGRAAKRSWPALSARAQAVVRAYVSGVNTFLAAHGGLRLPPEFLLLRFRPEPWTVEDVVAWSKLMSWTLSGNFSTELLRVELLQAVDPRRLAELLPAYPEDGARVLDRWPERTTSNSRLSSIGAEDLWATLGTGGSFNGGIGSNNWVVDPEKSATGSPVLANDPHLATGIPALWYVAHLSGGDLDAIGATIPGLPAVLIGRNRSIAWGVTSLVPDVQDLYREKLDAGGVAAEFAGAMEPLATFDERIEVRGGAAVTLTVRVSRHGPLISDALNVNAAARRDGARRAPLEPLALRWTAFDGDDRTIEAMLAINAAGDWAEFTEALRLYTAPAQNFVYADTAGNIGYYAAGRVPVRARGLGDLPGEGWSGLDEWTGDVPFEELPHALNPADHLITTANNRPAPSSYPHFLGREWQPPYRAQRIEDLLRATHHLKLDDHARIQADRRSLYAGELQPRLLALVRAEDELQRRALSLLQGWDGEMSAESSAAAIFAAWTRRLPRALVEDELGESRVGLYEGWFAFVSRFLVSTLADPQNAWCDDTRTAEREDCRAIAQRTFRDALGDLRSRLGTEPSEWRWARLHRLQFPHQPFNNVVGLRRLFSRTLSNGGDESTVNAAPFAMRNTFEQRFGPTYRQIIDLSAVDESRFLLPTGQSGHFLSRHYDDYMDDWQAMKYRPLRFQRAAVERDTESVLRLVTQ